MGRTGDREWTGGHFLAWFLRRRRSRHTLCPLHGSLPGETCHFHRWKSVRLWCEMTCLDSSKARSKISFPRPDWLRWAALRIPSGTIGVVRRRPYVGRYPEKGDRSSSGGPRGRTLIKPTLLWNDGKARNFPHTTSPKTAEPPVPELPPAALSLNDDSLTEHSHPEGTLPRAW